MILTVTLNAAVDRTYMVEGFTIDRVHRPSSWRIVAGGKGINVARVYHELGGDAMVTGLVGGRNGEFIQQSLRTEGLKADFVQTKGESRICIAIIDPAQGTQTELNEIGPEISQEEVEGLIAKFERLVPGMEYVILCGSTPPGISDNIYEHMISIAKKYGVPCVLDSSGAPLAQGLKATPFMVKPNVYELSGIVGHQLATIEEVVDTARGLVGNGIEIALVTLGRNGALVVSREGIWQAQPPNISFVSAVGSGDALGAAFVYVLAGGGTIPDALQLGVGAGAANATTFGAGFCSREDIYRIASETIVTQIDDR